MAFKWRRAMFEALEVHKQHSFWTGGEVNKEEWSY